MTLHETKTAGRSSQIRLRWHSAVTLLAVVYVMGCAKSGPTSEHAAGETPARDASNGKATMSENKRTIESFMDGFRKSDHPQILACLTDDVEWDIPGASHLVGKQAFDKEIENEAFVGRPTITVTRLTEENDVVVAEGSARSERKAGGFLTAKFCDVFEMQGGKIRQLTSYLMEVK